MSVTRWIFEYGGYYEYGFERNPDRRGGDTGWNYPVRGAEINILGANLTSYQIDGFSGGKRKLKFTAITGTMKRELEGFYLRGAIISNCSDHLYSIYGDNFSCFITEFFPTIHPTIGDFPGSGEDSWDLNMSLLRME